MRMLVRIQVRRLDTNGTNSLNLRAELTFDFLTANDAGANLCDKQWQRVRQIAARVYERGNTVFGRNTLAANEDQMTANSQLLVGPGSLHGIVERLAVCHQRRAGENPIAMRTNDSVVHTTRHSKVVGVENELFHLGWNTSEGSPNIITQRNAKHPAGLIVPPQKFF